MRHVIVLCALLCFASISDQKSTPEDDSYVAAVLEYQFTRNTEENLQNYLSYIQQAAQQKADIIVFPEMTLTRGKFIKVPIHGLLKQYPIPALHSELYDEILVSLSAAARHSDIYMVCNLQEEMDCSDAPGEYCPDRLRYVFNTNVVFDRNGAVIDRYRKINLFGEYTRHAALKPDLGVFSTDFGVTFGHFICFDLMFQVPATQIVQKHNLSDIVYTTMWFSEMPFLTAVEIQEAYAYTMDINFIAADANNINVGSAGSGIYSGKSGALISTMSGTAASRLLVARVPKKPGHCFGPDTCPGVDNGEDPLRITIILRQCFGPDTCPGVDNGEDPLRITIILRQVTSKYPGPMYDDPTKPDKLVLNKDLSLPSAISRELLPGFQEFTLSDKGVSCRFRVKTKVDAPETANTVPKFRAFVKDGVNTYVNRQIGVALCAIVACKDDSVNNCPYKFSKNEMFTEIQELEIGMTTYPYQHNSSLDCDNVVYYPSSLRNNKFPLHPQNFTFVSSSQNGASKHTVAETRNESIKNNNQEHITYKLNEPQNELMSFSIWGRIYTRDVNNVKDISMEDVDNYVNIENIIYNQNDKNPAD